MGARNNEGRKQTDCLGLFLAASSSPPLSPWGSQEVFCSGHEYQRSGPLQLLLEHLWQMIGWGLWKLKGLGACSVVTVLEHVCAGAIWGAVVGQGMCVLNACILRASGMWGFLTSMLSGICVGHYLLIQNQISKGCPYKCLSNSCTPYFPSVEWTQGSLIQLIMSRNMQINGGNPLPEMKPISFSLKMTLFWIILELWEKH